MVSITANQQGGAAGQGKAFQQIQRGGTGWREGGRYIRPRSVVAAARYYPLSRAGDPNQVSLILHQFKGWHRSELDLLWPAAINTGGTDVFLSEETSCNVHVPTGYSDGQLYCWALWKDRIVGHNLC